jgi:pimeloyl-ACP methyl ester carboxylesterase
MDALGCGRSDRSPRRDEVADYAQRGVSFLDALSIKKTSIVGNLNGASIAVEVAASTSDIVDKLILFDFPNYEPQVRRKRLNNPSFHAKEIKPDGSHLL